MNYLAFKGLKCARSLAEITWLESPVFPEKWTKENGVWVLRRKNDHFGIFAGMFEEASRYSNDVFICAPFIPGGRMQMKLHFAGWEANEAHIAGGPFQAHEIESHYDAARFIAGAWESGYHQQVPNILEWAALLLSDEIQPETLKAMLLYIASFNETVFEILHFFNLSKEAKKAIVAQCIETAEKKRNGYSFLAWIAEFIRAEFNLAERTEFAETFRKFGEAYATQLVLKRDGP